MIVVIELSHYSGLSLSYNVRSMNIKLEQGYHE